MEFLEGSKNITEDYACAALRQSLEYSQRHNGISSLHNLEHTV